MKRQWIKWAGHDHLTCQVESGSSASLYFHCAMKFKAAHLTFGRPLLNYLFPFPWKINLSSECSFHWWFRYLTNLILIQGALRSLPQQARASTSQQSARQPRTEDAYYNSYHQTHSALPLPPEPDVLYQVQNICPGSWPVSEIRWSQRIVVEWGVARMERGCCVGERGCCWGREWSVRCGGVLVGVLDLVRVFEWRGRGFYNNRNNVSANRKTR